MKKMVISMRSVVLFVVLVAVFSLGCLSCDELLREKGEYLTSLKEDIGTTERVCDDLELAIAASTSPARLADKAEGMGMVLAEAEDREFLAAADAEEIPVAEVEEESILDVISRLWRRQL